MTLIGKVSMEINVGDDPPLLLNSELTNEGVGMSSDEAANLVGDGNARVSASLDMADKNYGRGFSAHVTVSLTVNQDVVSIKEGYNLCSELCAEMVKDAVDVAGAAWKEVQ